MANLLYRKSLNKNLFYSPCTQINRYLKSDVIDTFVAELSQKKSTKWQKLLQKAEQNCYWNKILRKKAFTESILNDLKLIKNNSLFVDIENMSPEHIGGILNHVVEIGNENDFLEIINQCIFYQKLPNEDALIISVKFLSKIPNIKVLEHLSKITESINFPLYMKYAEFVPFKAIALWNAGSINDSIKFLENGFSYDSPDGKIELKTACGIILRETFTKKSNAVLITLLQTARSIHEKFNDVYLIAGIWKLSICSEWLSDNNIGKNLFFEYEELRNIVDRRCFSLCYEFLQNHHIEAVHRLIELLLASKSKESYLICLKLLFEYHYWERNLRACSEIIRTLMELEISLTEAQNQKFLNLLLNRPPKINKLKTSAREFIYRF